MGGAPPVTCSQKFSKSQKNGACCLDLIYLIADTSPAPSLYLTTRQPYTLALLLIHSLTLLLLTLPLMMITLSILNIPAPRSVPSACHSQIILVTSLLLIILFMSIIILPPLLRPRYPQLSHFPHPLHLLRLPRSLITQGKSLKLRTKTSPSPIGHLHRA